MNAERVAVSGQRVGSIGMSIVEPRSTVGSEESGGGFSVEASASRGGKVVFRLMMAVFLGLAVYFQGPDGGWRSDSRPVAPLLVLVLTFGWALWPRTSGEPRKESVRRV